MHYVEVIPITVSYIHSFSLASDQTLYLESTLKLSGKFLN